MAHRQPGGTHPLRLPHEVADRLGYYVYLYVDPRNNRPFYVGKGRHNRVLAYWDTHDTKSAKAERIAAIRRAGHEPRLDILTHGLPDEPTAFRIEAAVIDALLPYHNLVNQVRGMDSLEYGRAPLKDLVFQYAAKSLLKKDIKDPLLLIRINRLYRPGMPARDLYNATRARWKLGPRREDAAFALAVYQGVVRRGVQDRAVVPRR